jgi:outer membrane protein OmpA-like peptidoglycan-associated protein
MYKGCLLLILITFGPFSFCQQDFTIDPYIGTIYDLTEEDIEAGYGKHIYENEVIGHIEWEKIIVPNRRVTEKFTDVDFKTHFGIIFETTIHVEKQACFELFIGSDDGSKVWMDDSLVIDNGGVHKMIHKRAFISLTPGSHQLKLWYFQAFITHYGLTFTVTQLKKSCDELKQEEEASKLKTITLSNTVLFKTNEFEVKPSALPGLDSICVLIKEMQPKGIKVIGHTDSTGSESYNLILSRKRARSILNYLRSQVKDPDIKFSYVGMGETMAFTSNSDGVEDDKNRRVEIIFEADVRE